MVVTKEVNPKCVSKLSLVLVLSRIAALTPNGSIAHSIYEGGIGGYEVIQFLDKFEPCMDQGRVWGIIDNASILQYIY